MRIVMVTDDREIDRRILIEAATLTEAGHEVIVICKQTDSSPIFEARNGIKIERLPDDSEPAPTYHLSLLPFYDVAVTEKAPLPNPFNGLVYSSLRDALSSINRSLRWMHRIPMRLAHCIIFGDFLLIVTRRMLSLRVRRFLQALRRKGEKIYLPSFTLADICASYHVNFRGLNHWERQLLERILFYRPDVVHVHDLPQLAAGVEAKRATGCALVYDAHEIYPRIGTLSPKQSAELEKKERALVPSVDRMITVNPFIADWYAREYATALPVTIRNSVRPIHELNLSKRSSKLRELLQLDSNARILIFQGWLDASRGLANLITAMTFVTPDIHLVFIGYGEFVAEAKKLATKQRHRIHFIPKVTFDELTEYTLSADAGIIPYPDTDLNHHLCSPNKLFEFINAGLPIIANRLPYLEQVVDGEGFGVTEPLQTPADFARAIHRMFDPDLGGPERFRRALLARREAYLWDGEDKNALLEVYARLTK